jgi:hypothetical protein
MHRVAQQRDEVAIALDRLATAYRDAGLPAIRPAQHGVRRVLDEIRREIAPLFVELEDDQGPGGAVLDWAYGDDQFEVKFPSLSAYLDPLATMIELGEFARDEHGGSWVGFDPEQRWDNALAVRLAGGLPLPRFGSVRVINDNIRNWPAHWVASNGITQESRSPR